MKKLLVLLLVLVLVLGPGYSEVTFSDEQVAEMELNQQNIDNKLTQNEILLEQNKLKINSYESSNKIILSNNESITKSYESIISLQGNRITGLETSLKKEREANFFDSLFSWFIGFLSGYVILDIVDKITS